jgi:hypothetical protein
MDLDGCYRLGGSSDRSEHRTTSGYVCCAQGSAMNRVLFFLIATIPAAAPLAARSADGVIPCPGAGVSPHITFGGGWSTTIYINAFSRIVPNLTLRIYEAAGKPLQVPFSTANGLTGRASELVLTPGMGAEVIELLGTDPQLSTGWVTVQCTGETYVQITEVFRHAVAGRPDFEASVPFIETHTGTLPRYVFFPFDSRDGQEAGLAIVNVRKRFDAPLEREFFGINISCTGRDGNVIGTSPIMLESEFYGAWTLSSLVPATKGKVGYCNVTGSSRGDERVTYVIGLRFTPGGAFSTIPIAWFDLTNRYCRNRRSA